MKSLVVAIFLLLCCMPRMAVAEGPKELWLYYPTNFAVDENVDKLEKIWRRAAAAGYTHVLLGDSKFARLKDMEARYFKNVERAKKLGAELKLQIVPGIFSIGYSDDLLSNDVNLAEGLPVKDTLFVVKNGEARVVAEQPIAFSTKWDFKDDNVQMEGMTATVSDNTTNARFVQKLKVMPFRCYHISVEVKTEDYAGVPEVKVNVGDAGLEFTNLGVKHKQDWKTHHIIFNSQDHNEVTTYFGVWGNAKGKLAWRNWKVEEAGLLNVLRRDGAPCVVKMDGAEGKVLAEGKDYEPIADPRLGMVPYAGEYEVYHEPPTIHTKLADGTRVRVSWYHPMLTYDGQVMCCPSDPGTLAALADQAKRVKAAFGPAAAGYMMSYDEIRVLNWDESCQKRKMDAGPILAESVRQSTKLLEGSQTYTWSDMFDPYHNAVKKDYYLVRGDLTGSWEGLSKETIVFNWNFDKRDQSLKFFADRGHKQIIAGYYDGPVDGIKPWLVSAGKVQGVIGVMYTTWESNFDKIEAFARACRD